MEGPPYSECIPFCVAHMPGQVLCVCTCTSSIPVQGPGKTPYEGGVFVLDIKVPDQYPLVPPIVFFRTKMFHPNVHFKVTCQASTRSLHGRWASV